MLRFSSLSISVTGANRLRWLCGNAPDLHLEWLNQISAWFPAVLIEAVRDFCQFLPSSMVILTMNRPRQRPNSIGKMEDIMKVVHIKNKGRMLNTLENYHIYKGTVAGNQINDKQTSKSNKIFETVLKHDPPKMTTQHQ